MFKVNNKDANLMSSATVSIVAFKQVNAGWERALIRKSQLLLFNSFLTNVPYYTP